ncbi:MAG TPA: 30S ribosomal protein S16 [Parcubacteria group bacterium]|nr:30S ribosomal protein S16 [Parcubacteria group bacterium]
MLKMRLQRVGRKHDNAFRVVLTDSKNSSKSGKFKEVLGSYDPRKTVDVLKTDRIKYWLGQGALPTGTVHNLFVTHKIIDAKKKNVLPKKTPIVKEAPVVEEKPVVASAPAPEVVVEAPVEVAPEVAPEASEPVVESTEVAE